MSTEPSGRFRAYPMTRSRVAFLRNTNRIYRDNPDGTRTWMDEAEREREIARETDAESEACH